MFAQVVTEGRGKLAVYIDHAAHDRAIYVAGLHEAERWPRSNPMTSCI